MLEQIADCRTGIFDKTGRRTQTEQLVALGFKQHQVLTLVTSLEMETYSKHPLARAVLRAAKEAGLELPPAEKDSEQHCYKLNQKSVSILKIRSKPRVARIFLNTRYVLYDQVVLDQLEL